MVILTRLRQFHDSLNIALIQALGREFFCAKCAQFSLMVILTRLRHFHDSLKIALIQALGREFFCAKCAQFPLRFTELN